MPAKLTTEEFIKRSNIIHCNKYNYLKSVFNGSHIKIIITCKGHGDFEQTPANHLSGKGCRVCSTENITLIKKLTNEEFIKRARKVHKNRYDYSLVDYKMQRKKVKIICIKHGIFEQSPIDHWKEKGCPKCKSSKGEELITEFLENNKINYEIEYKFKKHLDMKKLRFDFVIFNPNNDIKMLIEYDGIGHYKSQTNWGGDLGLAKQKERDEIKNRFCKENKIKLLRIPYWDRNDIHLILTEELGV